VLLTELARNAAEATPPDATIRIATSRSASEVVLEVADAGRGMTQGELRHAFEPFYSTKPPVASTGLGLPVVRAIAERAGGHVDVLSRPGEGTTVQVRLPAARDGGADRLVGAGAPGTSAAGS
jgi:signal transduction histidine kinase